MPEVATVIAAVKPKEAEGESYRQPPSNVAAEQALLGAILINNEVLYQVGDMIAPEDFYDPLHQQIYGAIQKLHDRGQIANPVTLRHYFEATEKATPGGEGYLARLAAVASPVLNARDYAGILRDLKIKRELIEIGREVNNRAYDHDLDVNAAQQIELAEQELFNLAVLGDKEKSFQPLKTGIALTIDYAAKAYKNPSSVSGISTGLVDMDKLLGGLHRSDLLILAGRPSMGKTALATTMAWNIARLFRREDDDAGLQGKDRRSVGFFSLEMSSDQLAARMLSSATRVNQTALRRGGLTEEEFARLVQESQVLSALPFFVDDTPALSISALRARARRLKRTSNLSALVVDYLQLVRGSGKAGDNRVQEVSEITQGLKAIAKELDIPVIALSQLSRAVESRDDKRPQLSDLRESGSIEQDADIVMFVYREEYYLSRKKPRDDSPEIAAWQQQMEAVHGIADVIVAKHRNGPIGNIPLAFHSDTAHFGDLERNDYAVGYHG